MPTEKPIKQAH